MSDKNQPKQTRSPKKAPPAPHEQVAKTRAAVRAESNAPEKLLGGTVQSMAAEGQDRRQFTTREASAQILAAIKTARELGAAIEGNIVRISILHTGISAIDFLSKNGYRIIGV
jgi:transaldolase